MRIFNTLSGRKEEFIPIKKGKAKIYACGPTVYDYIHIGNARMLCVFDTLRRYMEWRGYDITFVLNFTDIDDKIIRRANEEGAGYSDIAEKFISEYKKDAEGLNIKPADIHPRATESMPEIIELIKTLIQKGYAYESGGDVYFMPEKFGRYGALSKQPLEDLEAGARVELSGQKRSPMDFALWKAAKPDEPFWESPWSRGRPGWHIECSAMVLSKLGNTIDIHCGGRDLIFPHHENEIAQSECATGAKYANFWMHNGFISVDNEKMSKSKNNFFMTRAVAEEYGYEAIRFMSIASHYRSPINYSTEVITQSAAALSRLRACKENLEFLIKSLPETDMCEVADPDFAADCGKHKEDFINELEDDFNTAGAIGALFDLVKTVNTRCAKPGLASGGDYRHALAMLGELLDVLGLRCAPAAEAGLGDEEIKALIDERSEAKKEKNYKKADEIRDRLKQMGITLEDTPLGTKFVRN